MKIVSWNVNGLRAVHKKGLFLLFIEKYKPDIVCLQEIKSEKNQNELDLKGYEEFWNPADRKGYSGTAIFSKIKPLSVQMNLPEDLVKKYKLNEDKYGNLNKEGRVLTVEFEDFYIVNCYTPNSKEDLSRLPLRHKKWDPAFLEYILRLRSHLNQNNIRSKKLRIGQEKNVIFCGDLNVAHTENDLANPKSNIGKHGFTDEERDGVDKMIENGFVDTFRIFTKGNGYYTWWTHFANARARNIGWRIDYFFTNREFLPKIKASDILLDVSGSDHCPVMLKLE